MDEIRAGVQRLTFWCGATVFFSLAWTQDQIHCTKKSPTLFAFLKRHFSVAVQWTWSYYKLSWNCDNLTQTLLLPQAAERLLHPELLWAKHNRYISQRGSTAGVWIRFVSELDASAASSGNEATLWAETVKTLHFQMDRTKIVGAVQYLTWKHNKRQVSNGQEWILPEVSGFFLTFNTFDLELAKRYDNNVTVVTFRGRHFKNVAFSCSMLVGFFFFFCRMEEFWVLPKSEQHKRWLIYQRYTTDFSLWTLSQDATIFHTISALAVKWKEKSTPNPNATPFVALAVTIRTMVVFLFFTFLENKKMKGKKT